ncbi:uncharacterized protein LOC123672243 isoform X1 [Harmonia axyridis]|uniref:uncharacterized protein LOC123672243 isoform X1 n=1 Tax=Harmonia axyridis TaxID=115357 RepID=UPI001E275011|nr:uncharacterized protein LOC123672243 isoform X1 [Harmonia axyridis]
MPGEKGKPKVSLEPFLRKMAIRDKDIVDTQKVSKSKRDSGIPSTSRKITDENLENSTLIIKDEDKPTQLVSSSFPKFYINRLVQVETDFEEHEKGKATISSITSTTMSIISEPSIKSSISSIKSTFKGLLRTEESPSFYQKMLIPFSGFTDADVKEIRGAESSTVNMPRTTSQYAATSSNVNDPRPVLKRYQSEKRKTSYERYVQETLENFLQTRNNTEDSSYNTVLAVKMMVNASKDEKISNFINDDHTEIMSKDTIAVNSELLTARLDRIINPPSLENSLTHNTQDATESDIHSSFTETECSQQKLQLMSIRKQLEQIDKQLIKVREEYDSAEKNYFEAKLNLHRMISKREKLLAQLDKLDVELKCGQKNQEFSSA